MKKKKVCYGIKHDALVIYVSSKQIVCEAWQHIENVSAFEENEIVERDENIWKIICSYNPQDGKHYKLVRIRDTVEINYVI